MKAFIFAAGLGTRLKPLTDSMPKALVPIGGKTLLEHVAGRIKSFGFKDFVVNVHHFAPMIIDFIEKYPDPDLHFSVSDESDLLRETGGGIRHAACLFDPEDRSPFLVHNVDILSDVDLGDFYRSHRTDALATLLVSWRETQRYLLFRREEGLLRLCGWMNRVTGQVRSPYPELRRNAAEGFDDVAFLKEHGLEMYAFSGVHVISPDIFPLMEKWPECFSIIDFYLSVAAEHRINAFVTSGRTIIDVGKLDTLSVAEKFVLK